MTETSTPNHGGSAAKLPRPARGPLSRLLNLFSNIWLGVSLLSLIFAYCWLGSGGLFYPTGLNLFSGENWGHVFVRQYFEKTEMEWFSWWPFNTLLALLATALITVTLRRIRLNLPNLGVWAIHSGIITLMIGSAIYFGRKVEGDVAIYRRRAMISAPGLAKPVPLILRPGNSTVVQAGDNVYHVAVASLVPDYVLLSGDDAGKKTYMAQLQIHGPDTEFIRQLLVGYPQYTEDVVPGKGRAINVVGSRLLDQDLSITLDYAPQEYFYLMGSAALYARLAGHSQWSVSPIPRLPHYGEYLASRESVFLAPGDRPPPIRPLDIPLRPEPGSEPIEGLSASVVAFIPYAVEQTRWTEGGPTLNPMASLLVRHAGRTESIELSALDSRHSRTHLGDATVRFRWIETAAELEELARPRNARLRVRVASKDVDLEVPVAELRSEPGFRVPDTDYVLSIRQMIPDWVLASDDVRGERAFIAWVDVTTPERRFSRIVVHPNAALSQDIDDSGDRHAEMLDSDLALELIQPSATELVVIAGPDELGLHAMLAYDSGNRELRTVSLGEDIEFLDGELGLRVQRIIARPRPLQRPALIPRRERDAKAGAQFSMIRVELTDAGHTQSVWLPFNNYPSHTRFGFFPRAVTLADGRQLELLYSRERRLLPVPIALEEFQLEVYPGRTRERDFISRIRFFEDGAWSDPVQVNSNNPTAHRRFWFFQSTWDPPDPASGYAGMNYTGLGVGNREAVYVMLGGTILSIAGMIYAFYVKPIIKRRRRRRVLDDLAAGLRAASKAPSSSASVQPTPQPAQTP